MNGSRLRALTTWHANGAVTDSLTEAHAADLRDWLVDLVEVSHVGVLELDLSEVEHIDDAGLEVLVSVSNLLARRGHPASLRPSTGRVFTVLCTRARSAAGRAPSPGVPRVSSLVDSGLEPAALVRGGSQRRPRALGDCHLAGSVW